ncbi:MAG: hypothetical protein V4675_21375 [Verrucomicrobiota bacterium]
MKTSRRLTSALLLALPAAALAQVVPTTPTKFSAKPVGAATATTGAAINPPSTAPTVKHITYLTLSPLRQWTSTDGKTLMGKLIAWEETVTTGPSPQSASAPPVTTRPTVLKNNQVRLLIDHKAYPVPLERLDPDARKFIAELQAHLAAKP